MAAHHHTNILSPSQAQFKDVPWDHNSLVVLRLYLQPAGAQGPAPTRSGASGNLLDESKLVAWTVMPLTVSVDGRAPRYGRSSQGNTRENVSFYILGSYSRCSRIGVNSKDDAHTRVCVREREGGREIQRRYRQTNRQTNKRAGSQGGKDGLTLPLFSLNVSGRLSSRSQIKLNVGTHWLPLFFPPVPDIPDMQLVVSSSDSSFTSTLSLQVIV